jgi:hypothetical protein
VKFYFPDSQDFIDPSFDFVTEKRSETRLRMRDDRYAHEVFAKPPFDGLLISKAIVDGAPGAPGKYSIAQRHRLLRVGAREFFRLDEKPSNRRLITMGDCGAFTYVREEYPPYSIEEVLDFYHECGFDSGISVDHVILAYDSSIDGAFPGLDVVAAEIRRRQEITLDLAAEFRRRHRARRLSFQPVGVAQGWSPASYTSAVRALQKMGYRRIALGGLVPLKSAEILETLEAVARVRRPDTALHLLGVTRTEHVDAFSRYGVESFDTTSPFRRAFKDATENYFTSSRTYTALRVPQVQGNRKFEQLITAGEVNQLQARRLERASLESIRRFDAGRTSVGEVLSILYQYEQLYDGERDDRMERYRETLTDRPWSRCRCDICREVGVEVIIFRGSERNKRRGFHNIFVLYQALHHELDRMSRGRTGNGASNGKGASNPVPRGIHPSHSKER